MIATAVVNGTLGFVMIITLCFCLGDVNVVLNSPVGIMGYPFIEVFNQGVQSTAGATVMTSIVIVLALFGCITNIATASRQLFAFARDKGVPFSEFFAYVSLSVYVSLHRRSSN
jgi:choline transport protein